MKYEVKLPAIAGDIIHLGLVAHAMALRDATAGGPDILVETYDGRLSRYEAMLLKSVRDGSLCVCDDVGDFGTPDEVVARGVADGTGVVLLPESKEVNVDATWLCHLSVKLKALNDWAAQRGDAFTISHEGVPWVEASFHAAGQVGHIEVRHRGGRETETAAGLVPGAKDAQPLEHWKMRVQAEAAAMWIRAVATGAQPSVAQIAEPLAAWCVTNDVKTKTRVHPAPRYLREHVLSGKHWTPPNITRAQAQKHAAQVAQVAQEAAAQVAQK